MEYTTDMSVVKNLLESIDQEFFPAISVQEGSVERYVKTLLEKGKVIIHRDDTHADGLFGYFIRDNNLVCDVLWISKEKRKSFLIKQLMKYVTENEPDFRGKVKAKTHKGNEAMVQVLERLGFELTGTIQNDYVEGRTSLLFETDFSNVKNYFSRSKSPRPSYGIGGEIKRMLYYVLYFKFWSIRFSFRYIISD